MKKDVFNNKKKYVRPKTTLVVIQTEHLILAASESAITQPSKSYNSNFSMFNFNGEELSAEVKKTE